MTLEEYLQPIQFGTKIKIEYEEIERIFTYEPTNTVAFSDLLQLEVKYVAVEDGVLIMEVG